VSAFAFDSAATTFIPSNPIARASALSSNRQARSSRNGLISASAVLPLGTLSARQNDRAGGLDDEVKEQTL
jgi:hypothetical protein